MSFTVFISYARIDSDFAHKIIDALKQHGITTWIDESSIQPGEDWFTRIGQAVKDCQMMLVILSPNSMNSKWVKRELKFADRQQKRVLPLLQAPCSLPPDLELIIGDLQWADFTKGDFEKNLSSLLDVFHKIPGFVINESPQTTEVKPDPTLDTTQRKKISIPNAVESSRLAPSQSGGWDRNVIIKSKGEIETMRAGGKIASQVLNRLAQMITPGVTTAELDFEAEKMILLSGAKPVFKGYPGPYPFPATIITCINEEFVHGIPGKRKLLEGDILSIQVGLLHEGFCSLVASTFPVGIISTKADRLLKVTQRALELAIEKLYPGNRTGDVSAAIQQFVEANGFSVTREYTGHGIGRKQHEGPQVPCYGVAGRGLVLRPGLVLGLESLVLTGSPHSRVLADHWTVVSEDLSLTAEFKHTVAVTENGPQILTLP